MVAKIRSAYPTVTAAQVYNMWQEHSQAHWRRDDLQLPSARKHLDEFRDEADVFEPKGVPEGIEILAWEMSKIAGPLKGGSLRLEWTQYNTNSKHLELYSIMAEYNNAGFPLTYCLLSTATATDPRKRIIALMCSGSVQHKPNLHARRQGRDWMSKGHLEASKISLCWWHLRRTRLAKAKLSTTPYEAQRVHAKFNFIDTKFVPPSTKVDIEDYEGGIPDEQFNDPLTPSPPQPSLLGNVTNVLRVKISLPSQKPVADEYWTFHVGVTRKEVNEDEDDEDAKNAGKGQRTFYPALYRDSITEMMERHYCAHPMIPGYVAPEAGALRRWAVHQMYRFCLQNQLPEVWAYLWGNWYRKGRWELWARSFHSMIQDDDDPGKPWNSWCRIKREFLYHFRMPRCDLLVWILVMRLAPRYYTKLDRLENWFLICKHLIQRVHQPPPIFFLEVKHNRTIPFWSHRTLTPIEDDGGEVSTSRPLVIEEVEAELPESDDDDDEFDDVEVPNEDGRTSEEVLQANINFVTDFLGGLHYQAQFRDQRMLNALEREGGGFLRLARHV
ncbi:hypothetical protein BDN72DRAFT_870317 [Pluteus cervinus]|uniref:Uncharacterized protein n=1 Tax=Pluteus cervinus TaxID=181527 RepID=A0ACD3AYE2_9AGAR|nr:hypothetical protein BDN72DRAFT_870317 [Pluteus cervinus]